MNDASYKTVDIAIECEKKSQKQGVSDETSQSAATQFALH